MVKSPIYLGFYGFSNTGKTTLITGLIEKLKRKNYVVLVSNRPPILILLIHLRQTPGNMLRLVQI